ncbi:MAG TPA: hypothetical protein VNK46_04870 [Nitrospiraceae bacterium]|nr:hypothetical protein [Nitrospiraceae bacterium]
MVTPERRIVRLIALLFPLAMFLSACSSKGPQYPEDHERFRRIDAAVESLRKAYVNRDASALEALMLPLDALERLHRDVRRDFDSFQEIALDWTIERIVIDGDNIDVFVHWQGQWKREPGEPGIRQRGHGRLQWVGVQSILLKGLEGDLPFGMTVRQAGSEQTDVDSGKGQR